ncbi:hypothetical protein ACK8P5_26740 (plasmid) [Paenibacillus sp. EC2-1]|uniref:hypothetical protein n=1 Tax=Paenibacillus sp. EC2-1 TaxID=3388665 RepID=UPI003BEEC5D5
MPNRVRLTWDRNQDVETEHYRVFRDEQPNLDNRNNRDKVVMIVDHPKHVSPVTIRKEILQRETEKTYSLAHTQILIEHNNTSYPFKIAIDDIDSVDFTLDREHGKVIFDYPVSETSTVVALEYTFDGVQAWDYDVEEEGKKYYGPEAKDTTPPSPPQNVTLERDVGENRIIIRWQAAELNGKRLYYRIDAAIDEQRYSKLGDLRSVFLREALADRPYVVERSEDGVRWTEIAKTKTNEFFEYSIDRKAPPAIRGLDYNLILQPSQSQAIVELSWSALLEDNSSSTSMYRIRARNKVGIVSDPSAVVGPVEMKVGIEKVIIRRKTDDGTIPSYAGNDATTISVITDLSQLTFTETVGDNTKLVYGLWVVDKAGNYSPISFVQVTVRDATPPATPTGIQTNEFHIVSG